MDVMSAITAEDLGSKAETETGEDADTAEFMKLKRMVKEGHAARSDWRTEAARAFDFVAGHQWSEDDQRILDEQGRPAVTFNRSAPIIKAVCGLEVNNRQGVIYLPRKEGDGGADEARTSAAKWAREECNAEDEESEAFRDAAICGEGWVETSMTYDEEVEGKIMEERIDPLEMGTNKGACKSNYNDARMIYRVRDMDKDDAMSLLDADYPNLLPEAVDARWMQIESTPSDGGEGNKNDYPGTTRSGVTGMGGGLRKVRMVMVQWWERENVNLVGQANGNEVEEMTDEEFAKYQQRAQLAGVTFQHTTVTKKCYYEAFLGAEQILGKRKLPMPTFRFRCITGERDRKKKMFYGMLRDMFDPQMWANKWLSQTMHIMNTNAKGGIMAETDAFVNVRKAEKDWADNRKIVWVKPGGISGGKIKERTPPPLPQGLGELMTFAIGSLRDVTGVNLELLGQADREQAASLEMQRRQSAMTILATLFDSLRRFRKAQGRLLLHFIGFLPDGTLIRIFDKDKYKYIPLVKDSADLSKYDVIVDQAPSSPNQKEAVWVFITQLLQSGIQLSPPTIVKLLKYSPLPETVVAEIAESMGLGEQMPPEMLKEKLEQAEDALKVMEQELTKAMEEAKNAEDEHNIELMKLEIEEYKAETQRLAAQWGKLGNGNGSLDVNSGGDNNNTLQGGGGQVNSGNEEVLGQLVAQVTALTQMMQQLVGGGQPPSGPPEGQEPPQLEAQEF